MTIKELLNTDNNFALDFQKDEPEDGLLYSSLPANARMDTDEAHCNTWDEDFCPVGEPVYWGEYIDAHGNLHCQ